MRSRPTCWSGWDARCTTSRRARSAGCESKSRTTRPKLLAKARKTPRPFGGSPSVSAAAVGRGSLVSGFAKSGEQPFLEIVERAVRHDERDVARAHIVKHPHQDIVSRSTGERGRPAAGDSGREVFDREA